MLSRHLTTLFWFLALLGTAGAASTTRVSTRSTGGHANDPWSDTFPRDLAPPPPPPACLVRESVDTAGGDTDQPSTSAYISADGHWVAFSSLADDLVPGDTNGVDDVFLRDRAGRITYRCSYGSGGQADGPSEAPSVSADGRFVAFASSATNLVPGDTNGTDDIFVYDRNLGTVARVSVSSAGDEGNGSSYPPPWGRPSISPDGRYVAFCSQASNLVANDTNATWDVFVHDRDFDHDGIYDEHVPGGIRTWRASVSSTGEEGHADSGTYGLWLSAYGRFVAFQSNAWNFIPNDLNGSDIFVHNNINGATTLVSLDNNGAQAFGFHSLPSISADLSLAADGRFVTWTSNSPVTPEDQNGVDDIFLRDRTLNQTSMVSIGTGGIQADWGSSRSMVNASGSRIVFDSQASTFTPGDGTIAWDIFIRDPQAATTDLVSQPQGMGDSIWPTIDASGEIIAFSSNSPVLVGGDANNLSDVFVQDCNTPVYVAFCAPGVDGIVPCPCGNPQVPAGSMKGCNNFAGGGSGGATLTATGVSSLSADTLGFQLAGGVASNVTVLFQGTGNAANTRSGAGVRCVGGTLKRLYRGQQSAGSIAFPNDGVSVHDASAAKGYVIGAPSTLFYYCAYRNSAANGHPGCPGLGFGFNTTHALAVPWSP